MRLLIFVFTLLIFFSMEVSASEKESYALIEESLLRGEAFIGYATTEDRAEVDVFVQEIINNNPNLSHVSTWLMLKDSIYVSYHVDQLELKRRNRLVEAKVDEVLARIIEPSFTDREKVQAVHDYVVKQTRYDYDSYYKGVIPGESSSPYGVLIQRLAVCEGYTRTVQLMLDELGIPNKYTVGYVGDDLHSWNRVQLNGKYYHVDATFNDPSIQHSDYVKYDYYLVADDVISRTRLWGSNRYGELIGNRVYR